MRDPVELKQIAEPIRLQRWHRWSIYLTLASLAITGAVWLLAHYFGRSAGEFADTPHPLEPWSLRLHGLAAFFTLFFAGSLLNSHMRRAWQLRRNRMSGGWTAAVFVVLTVSAYLLYYGGGENMHIVISLLHWIVGLALVPLFVMHILIGRKASA
jgi:hypothetical protein